MTDVVAVLTDLFFQGRIAATARAVGRSVQVLSSESAVRDAHPRLALVDLDAQLDVPGVISMLKARGATVVVFGPHLDTERRKTAREAGADRVLANSRFVAILPQLLSGGDHHSQGPDRE